jgi:hypothetical protein
LRMLINFSPGVLEKLKSTKSTMKFDIVLIFFREILCHFSRLLVDSKPIKNNSGSNLLDFTFNNKGGQ